MQKLYVTKRFTFEAAHNLPNYDGLCANLHGHSYKLEVTVSGETCQDKKDSCYGMVIDFKKLKVLVNETVIKSLDHHDLNGIYSYPTAELMTINIYDTLLKVLPNSVKLESIKLWETEDSYVEYRG